MLCRRHGLPDDPSAPAPHHSFPSRHRARDVACPSDLVYPMFFHAALTEPRAIKTMPGIFQLPVSHAARRPKSSSSAASSRPSCLACQDERRDGLERARPGRARAAGRQRDEKRRAGAGRDDRRLRGRVHRPRPLRHPVRRVATAILDVDNDRTRLPLLADQMAVMPRRAPARTSIAPSGMMDGMRRARSAQGARRERGSRRSSHPELRRQVRERVLRPVPRGGRLRAPVRRPGRLPDGPGQRA